MPGSGDEGLGGSPAHDAAAAAAPSSAAIRSLLFNILQEGLVGEAGSAGVAPTAVPLHPEAEKIKAGDLPSGEFASSDNPFTHNRFPRPPTAGRLPQFFGVWNEVTTKLSTAQQKEYEVLYACASYLSDVAFNCHEIAVANPCPQSIALQEQTAGVVRLMRKRLDVLRTFAVDGHDAGAYMGAATINPLADELCEEDSRAAYKAFQTATLKKQLNTAVWSGTVHKNRGRGNGGRGGGGWGGGGGGIGSSAAASRLQLSGTTSLQLLV